VETENCGHSILKYNRILKATISKIYKIKFKALKPGVRNVRLTYGMTRIYSVAMEWSETTERIERIKRTMMNIFKPMRNRDFVFRYES
jgi:hypothetical protein